MNGLDSSTLSIVAGSLGRSKFPRLFGGIKELAFCSFNSEISASFFKLLKRWSNAGSQMVA
ncbi:hypothetical protein DSO57_1029694 [Entomophthora muscae]|uniref:Uncharacterized protein n=1 Tax=Entomophthora muscae TaxID=34485 RepID=A0ACC2RFT5_9FUNG|nr:hypothetical protein DSO57_1029694 [Entomophthora muscae]